LARLDTLGYIVLIFSLVVGLLFIICFYHFVANKGLAKSSLWNFIARFELATPLQPTLI